MHSKLILSLVMSWITLTFAQTLDTVLRLPEPPDKLFHISKGNKMYIIGRSDNVYVLNCSAMVLTSVIAIGAIGRMDENYPVWAFRHNKLYFGILKSPPLEDIPGLVVVDGAPDSIVNVLDVDVWGEAPYPLAYNSTLNKIYAAGQGLVTILDCYTDTILKIIRPADYSPGGFAIWDSIGNKVYVGSVGWSGFYPVTVIDCHTDSVIAVIRTSLWWPSVAVYNAAHRKLYVGGAGEYGLNVIDCLTNQVVKRFDSIWSDFDYIPAYSSLEDKVYWPAYGNPVDTLWIINCSKDSILHRVTAPGVQRGLIRGCAYSDWNDRLYVLTARSGGGAFLTVFDCATDSIIGQAQYGNDAHDVVCNPVDHKIYVAAYWDSAVYVFREDLQPVEEMKDITLRGFSTEPTVIRNVLFLPSPASGERLAVGAFLLDISGRKVLDLKSGANPVRRLAPGVYFIQIGSAIERKVVIAK